MNIRKTALLPILLLTVILALIYSCKKDISNTGGDQTSRSRPVKMTETATACGCWIACTNQANNQIEVYDPAVYYWDNSTALKWTFIPTTSRGYDATAEIPLWGGPTDVKLRNTNVFAGTSQVIVTAGGRLATIAAYPSGNKIWTMGYSAGPPAVSIHSAELLPNGNIALASADRNWVRVYSSSQPVPNHDNFAEFTLNSAHAVLWDPTISRLWVTGWLPINSANYWDANNQVLTALIVGGTALNPTLSEDLTRRVILPGKYGHDVYPYYYDVNKLWVSLNVDNADNNKGVYIYDKTTKTFTGAPGLANRNFVKAIGNQPSGQIVEIRPADPVNNWVNDTVNFYTSAGAYSATRIKTGAAFYKARVFDPDYQ